jgi:hypothetical protein
VQPERELEAEGEREVAPEGEWEGDAEGDFEADAEGVPDAEKERERVLANLESSDVKVRRLKRQLKDLMEDSGKLQQQQQQELCKAKREHEKERDVLKKQMRQAEEEKLKEVLREYCAISNQRLSLSQLIKLAALQKDAIEQDEEVAHVHDAALRMRSVWKKVR